MKTLAHATPYIRMRAVHMAARAESTAGNKRRSAAVYGVMDDHSWQFDDIKASLLSAIEALNNHIRDVAHAPPAATAHNRIEEWDAEVGRTIAILESAKKVILSRLGPGVH